MKRDPIDRIRNEAQKIVLLLEREQYLENQLKKLTVEAQQVTLELEKLQKQVRKIARGLIR